MHSKRFGVGVAVVNRLLYAIGGFDGNDRLASMECYHPENNAWTILPSMKLGRSGAGVVAMNQHIYVVGGFDGQNHLSSVERFDTEQLAWEMVAEIRTPRSALSLTVLDGKLFAMGGFDGKDFLTNVEVYDPSKNEWTDGTPLTSGRSGHASAVIYQPAVPSGGTTHQETVAVNGCTAGKDGGGKENDGMRGAESNSSGGRRPSYGGHLGGRTGNRGCDGNGGFERSMSMETDTNGASSRDEGVRRMPERERRMDVLRESDGLGQSLIDIRNLKCDNGSTANSSSATTVRQSSMGEMEAAGTSSQPRHLQVVSLESLVEPGPSSRCPLWPTSSAAASDQPSLSSYPPQVSSPPIRVAKKREAESPNIPSTPPSDSDCKDKSGGASLLQPQPLSMSGVKTFLPVVDFQNQRKYRRKINPMPVRHPSYMSPQEVPSMPTPMVEPMTSSGGCAAMNKIKEAVKQKLFSPSMLMSGGGGGGVGHGGGCSFQEKTKVERSNMMRSRRSVLRNAADEDDSESDN